VFAQTFARYICAATCQDNFLHNLPPNLGVESHQHKALLQRKYQAHQRWLSTPSMNSAYFWCRANSVFHIRDELTYQQCSPFSSPSFLLLLYSSSVLLFCSVSLSCLCPSVLSFCSVSLSCLCPSVLCPCRVCVLLFCPSVPSLCSVSLSCLCPSVLSFCTVLLFCVLVVSMSFCSVLLLSFSFGTLSEAVLPHPPPLLISISDGPICACSYYLLIIMSAEN